ncbi:MAG: hypothetical protein RJA19_426 [Bacteroidota bacterium]
MHALWTLNPLIWKYKWHLLGGILFIFLTNIFAVYAPALIGEGVNALGDAERIWLSPLREGQPEAEVLSPGGEVPKTPDLMARWWPESAGNQVHTRDDIYRWMGWVAGFQALLYIAVFLIKGLFLFFTRQTIIILSRRVEFDLKGQIFDHYQRLDAAFYKSHDTGDLMNRISEDVSKVRMYLGPALMYTFNLVILILLVVGVMLYIDVQLTLFALLPLPLMSFAIYRVSRTIHTQSERVQQEQSGLSSFVQQHVAGIRVLKAFGQEAPAEDRFRTASDRYKQRALDLVRTEALFGPIIVLLVGLSTILTVYIGGLRVVAGELELGHIFQFVFYVNLLTWPFASVGWVTSLVQKAEASMVRINDFLMAKPELVSGTRTSDAAPLLAFDRVSFRYPDTGIEALKDVSFTLRPGATLAITGSTGSGKSTVAQLAMRIYDPQSGTVSWRGTPLPQWDLSAFRAETGYVAQDVFLFSDTIRANVAFGLDLDLHEIDQEVIAQATRDAHVAHNIERFPQGYDTLLGERGVNLSGGQKQRISIARALARRPALLILDDCLSAVDTETEDHILRALKRRQEEARAAGNQAPATLVVSHRISSIQWADHVLVLDQGTCIESGTPEELLALRGVYWRMAQEEAATETGS